MPVATMDKNHNNYILFYKYCLFILFFPCLRRTETHNLFSFTWVTEVKSLWFCLLLSLQLTAHCRLLSSRLSVHFPGTALLTHRDHRELSPRVTTLLIHFISYSFPGSFILHLDFTYLFICLLLFIIIDSWSSSLSSLEWSTYSFISINSSD